MREMASAGQPSPLAAKSRVKLSEAPAISIRLEDAGAEDRTDESTVAERWRGAVNKEDDLIGGSEYMRSAIVTLTFIAGSPLKTPVGAGGRTVVKLTEVALMGYRGGKRRSCGSYRLMGQKRR